MLYFISQPNNENSKILCINLTKSNYFNNSYVVNLNGINNVKDIVYDKNKNIFITSGLLSTKIYKMDKFFNIIPLSLNCGIDSLDLPVEWNSAQSMEIDSVTGVLYLFFIYEPYNGYYNKSKDMSSNFNQFSFYRRGQLWTLFT